MNVSIQAERMYRHIAQIFKVIIHYHKILQWKLVRTHYGKNLKGFGQFLQKVGSFFDKRFEIFQLAKLDLLYGKKEELEIVFLARK